MFCRSLFVPLSFLFNFGQCFLSLRFTDSDYPFWHLQTLLKYRIAEDCTKLKSLERVIRIVNHIYEAKKQYPSPLHDLFMYLYKNTPCRAIEKVASSFDKTLLFAGVYSIHRGKSYDNHVQYKSEQTGSANIT